jgi:hypothetical protein
MAKRFVGKSVSAHGQVPAPWAKADDLRFRLAGQVITRSYGKEMREDSFIGKVIRIWKKAR